MCIPSWQSARCNASLAAIEHAVATAGRDPVWPHAARQVGAGEKDFDAELPQRIFIFDVAIGGGPAEAMGCQSAQVPVLLDSRVTTPCSPDHADRDGSAEALMARLQPQQAMNENGFDPMLKQLHDGRAEAIAPDAEAGSDVRCQ